MDGEGQSLCDTSSDILERADRLLYRSKADGTNKVSIDEDTR